VLQRAGTVVNTGGLRDLANAMLADPRSQGGADALAQSWLGNEDIEKGGKYAADAAVTPELRQSMATEQRLFLREMLVNRSATLTNLLREPITSIDARLAPLYDLPAPMTGFGRTPLDGTKRSGLLTQPGLLATWPRAAHRGIWLNERLLCQQLPPPPPGPQYNQPVVPDPGESYRGAFDRQVGNQAECAACHRLMDLGFALEHFDSLGRYRATDGGKPIDASVRLPEPTSNASGVTVVNAPDLGTQMARRCDVQACVARSFLAFAFNQKPLWWFDTRKPTGPDQPSFDQQALEVMAAFAESNFRVGDLMVAVTQTPLFLQP
jgi:hypothetical protein